MKIDSVASALAIIGAIFVAFNNPLYANIVWSVSNPMLVYYNYKINQFPQLRMFSVFTFISIFGVFNTWK